MSNEEEEVDAANAAWLEAHRHDPDILSRVLTIYINETQKLHDQVRKDPAMANAPTLAADGLEVCEAFARARDALDRADALLDQMRSAIRDGNPFLAESLLESSKKF